MPGFLLDSSVLIDYLRANPEVVAKLNALAAANEALGVCAINVAEVFAGMREPEQSVTEEWLSSLDWHDITYDVAQAAGEEQASLRRAGRNVDLADVMIGCVARANAAVLLTDNVKDFQLLGLLVERLPSSR